MSLGVTHYFSLNLDSQTLSPLTTDHIARRMNNVSASTWMLDAYRFTARFKNKTPPKRGVCPCRVAQFYLTGNVRYWPKADIDVATARVLHAVSGTTAVPMKSLRLMTLGRPSG